MKKQCSHDGKTVIEKSVHKMYILKPYLLCRKIGLYKAKGYKTHCCKLLISALESSSVVPGNHINVLTHRFIIWISKHHLSLFLALSSWRHCFIAI